jgi:hypothetical protein
MTALPHTMPDAEIRREYLQHEHAVIVSAPRLNVGAYVRNIFDSMVLDSVPFRTERDSYDFILRQLEGRYGRPLTPHEAGILGRITAQEFNTRRALSQLDRSCPQCRKTFSLDERRHLVRVLPSRDKRFVCTACLDRCDYRDVFTTSTVREQMRELGLGIEDVDRAWPVVPTNDQHEDFPVYERVRCSACGELVAVDDFDAKAKTCKECERKRAIESGEALEEWRRWRDE